MRKILMFALAAAALAAPALAQDDVMDHYAAYLEAVEEGRSDDAVAAAVAAWRAAQASWGLKRDTGALAFNAAKGLIEAGRDVEALEPARAAQAAVDAGLMEYADDPGAIEADVLLGIAELAEGERGRGVGIDRLIDALEAQGDAASSHMDIITIGWLRAAQDARDRERWRDAQERAQRARSWAVTLGPGAASDVLEASQIEALAAVRRGRYEDARDAFSWAIEAYSVGHPDRPPVANDPDLAQLFAWESAMNAVLFTRYNMAPRTGTHLLPRRPADDADAGPVRETPCFEWADGRRTPQYPAAEQRQGLYGVVLMAYDVTPEGGVENARVAATAPSEISQGFVDSILEVMPTWRATVATDADAACLRDQITDFQFVFE